MHFNIHMFAYACKRAYSFILHPCLLYVYMRLCAYICVLYCRDKYHMLMKKGRNGPRTVVKCSEIMRKTECVVGMTRGRGRQGERGHLNRKGTRVSELCRVGDGDLRSFAEYFPQRWQVTRV